MHRRRISFLCIVMLIVASATVCSYGQGFDSPSRFGETEVERSFEPPQVGPANKSSYFVHDQVLKLALLLAFSTAALGLVFSGRYRFRKWLLVSSVIALGFVVGGFLCPVTAVQNMVLKAHTGYLVLFLVPIVLALIAGRVYCGVICPFGALQELLHVRQWQRRVPKWLTRWLAGLPYLLLIALFIRVLVAKTVILQGYTPFKSLFTWGGTPMTVGLTAATALASVFIYRPFCRFFCPLGAFLALVSRFSLFCITSDAQCIRCTRCTKGCAVGAMKNGQVDTGACLLCGACVAVCPKGSLKLRSRVRKKEENRSKGTDRAGERQ
jgi:polyferredoxin